MSPTPYGSLDAIAREPVKPRRVVFDTNVVLSALLFRSGSLAPLRLMWSSQKCVPLVSAAMAEELLRALSYPKFKLNQRERDTLLLEYLPYCEAVAVPHELADLPECRDANDRMVLALAFAANADALVTGDRDLLALDGRFAIPILTPVAFLRGAAHPPA